MTDDAEWARCRHWIIAALENSPGFESIEDIDRKLENRDYVLWPGTNCAAVTCLIQYDGMKVLSVIHGGGDLEELLTNLEPNMCKFAAMEGCKLITGEGRLGWKPVSEKHGYRFGYIVMVKEIAL